MIATLLQILMMVSLSEVTSANTPPVDQTEDRINIDPDRLNSIKSLSRAYCSRTLVTVFNVESMPRCAEEMDDRECRMFRLINAFRHFCGRTPLKASSAATRVARQHSQYMSSSERFEHSNRGWRNQQIRQGGHAIRSTGENIAMQWSGYGTLRATRKLIQSDGHRSNILAEMYSSVGIGKSIHRNRYWTQIFCVE